MLAPAARGLFSQAVLQSGSVINDPSSHFGESPAFYAAGAIDAVGCEAGVSSEDVLACLREKSADEIVSQTGLYEKFFNTFSPWKPVVDANFSSSPLLPDEPINLFMAGKYQSVSNKAKKR